MKKKIVLLIIIISLRVSSQCNFIPSTSTATDVLSYAFSGGSFASYGCAPIDPTYWLSNNGNAVTINFINPQTYPTFRVWGMNPDDSAEVKVNNVTYPLNSISASYDAKVVCGNSPGPDGVLFALGKLVGANAYNFSYQNIQLNITNVSSISITGISGAGWGFAGISVNCGLVTHVNQSPSNGQAIIFPNPFHNEIIVSVKEKTEVTIKNSLGQTIEMEQTFLEPHKMRINLEILPTGIYFVEIKNAQSTIVKKVIKE